MAPHVLRIGVFFLLFWLPVSCTDNGGRDTLRELVHAKADRLETVSERFLADTLLRGIIITAWYDRFSCEMVNSWRQCYKKGPWRAWNMTTTRYDSLPNLAAVLKQEKINPETYAFYTDFLKNEGLHSLDQSLACEYCTEIELGLDGLIYSRDTTFRFKADREYMRVERLTPHWHLYTRDWN